MTTSRNVRQGLVFAAALAVVAAAVYFGVRAVLAPPDDDGEGDPVEVPDLDLERGERFEEVRSFTREVYESFSGKVSASSLHPIRAPKGQRTPIERLVKDQGDAVKKGDLLVVFNGDTTRKALEKARAAGTATPEIEAQAAEWLANLELRSPCDGFVYDVWRDLGEIPVDVGIPLMQIAEKDSFALRVQVPKAVTRTVAHIGAKLTVDLDANLGTTGGTVTAIDPAGDESVLLTIGLEPKEGFDDGLGASVRVPASKQEVALVPKAAVGEREGVRVVRVFETDDRTVAERTIQVDGEQGSDWIVVAGVFPGEHVVVRDGSRR